jgi:hypothetical protein
MATTYKECPFVSFSIVDQSGSIVLMEVTTTQRIDLFEAREIVAARFEFTQNKKHYLVIDLSNVKQVSPEAKDYLQHAEGGLKNILASALVATNPVSALIANIFVKTTKEFEAKFFTDKNEAFAWINDIVNNVPGQ